MYSSLYLRGEVEVEEEEEEEGGGGGGINETGFVDLEELEQPAVFHPYPPNESLHHHAVVVDSIPSIRSMYNNVMKPSNVSAAAAAAAVSNNLLQLGCLNPNIYHQEIGSFLMQKGSLMAAIGGGVVGGGGGSLGSGNFDSWGDSTATAAMADNNSQQTDTSTDVDTDDKNHHHHHHHHHPQSNRAQLGLLAVMDSDQQIRRTGDQKTLRRLAQNREAARKSRLRKKAYVQQLEHSRIKLNQLEQEVQRTRHQGLFVSSLGLSMDQGGGSSVVGNGGGGGALAFNAEYARWLGEHHLIITELRSALSSQAGESELRLLVDGVISHYDELFRLKGVASKSDVFHVLSGMWKTPAERCFMWLGGFRSSELLKILGNQLEPLTDQQLVGICNLQQSSQQAEDALSQGVEALQQSLLETLLPSLGPCGGSGNVADYMGQMAIAMSKLSTLENFIHQADILRQQTLQQLHRILTTRQAGHALLVINDYMARLRALSSLWLARPRN